MSAVLQKHALSAGLLPQYPVFDCIFIGGTLALALGLGGVASISPAMLIVVVLVDIWLFANPHLVATFTRIAGSAADIRKHCFLIFGLPVIVLGALVAIALAYEVAGLFTLYFVAQGYHVARQSFGIVRAYRRSGLNPLRPDMLTEALVYLIPLWGLLVRCAEAPTDFLGYPIQLPAVSVQMAEAVGLVAIVCSGCWLWRQGRVALSGQIDWRHDCFVASHVCVCLVAYLWIADITLGWLVINLWHNLQYLLFVWMKNLRRDQQVLGYRVLEGMWESAVRYGSLCLLLGGVLYLAVDWVGAQLLWLGLPTVLIAHFTLNFHHYLMDGVIWRRRRMRPES